ncbi:uncharacterized protein V2V93DRAFT_365005 [Kockiozyma suomiensis]|uniref:uncharacterized protein n=1 Tax=Kockiozyma suomiensis TaxID=1337062 RepID=UPI0033439B6D
MRAVCWFVMHSPSFAQIMSYCVQNEMKSVPKLFCSRSIFLLGVNSLEMKISLHLKIEFPDFVLCEYPFLISAILKT